MNIQRAFDNGDSLLFKKQFETDGFVGPVKILQAEEAEKIASMLSIAPSPIWLKGNAVSSRDYYDIATHPSILDRVAAVLGNDIMLWGVQMVIRKPGIVHPWHSDMETVGGIGQTVSVWLGLDNVNYNSSLQLIRYSHKFGKSIQEMRYQTSTSRSDVNQGQVLKWAKEMDPNSKLLTCSMKNGDAVFFDGNLWHGTNNINLIGTRKALLIQYATPDRPIQVPDYKNLNWPFQFRDDIHPPCIMVKGTDKFGVNEIVEPPSASSNIKSWVVQLSLPLQNDPETGWKPHQIHAGSSPTMDRLTCHASVLNPGHTPHPPHSHIEEEILIVLEGKATILIGQGEDQQAKNLERGDFVYYPGAQLHTIRNDSESNITYLMFKWRNKKGKQENGHLKTHISDPENTDVPGRQYKSGTWNVKKLLEGPTQHLSKLHSHISILKPGGGYEPHSDPYDVAILLLSGTVETIGRIVKPNGVIFYKTGEPHGIRNIGDKDAVYLVFEFHGRKTPVNIKRLIKKTRWKILGYTSRILPEPLRKKIRRAIYKSH